MLNVNQDRMDEVIQRAFDKVTDRRWQTAIARAKREIESNPFMHYDGDALLVLFDSNEIYSVNGTCQCRAYQNRKPCWHRAAARLVQRYNETSH